MKVIKPRFPDTRRMPAWEKRLLDAPRALYRWHLGALLGDHFVLLTHQGRKTGRLYQTLLHVIRADPRHQMSIVVADFGPDSDWAQNCATREPLLAQTGGQTFCPQMRRLTQAEALRELLRYLRRPSPVLALRFVTVWRRFPPTPNGMARIARELPLFAIWPRVDSPDVIARKTNGAAEASHRAAPHPI